MTSTILVTGGTGELGRHVVPLLAAPGRHLRVLSRHGRPAPDPGSLSASPVERVERVEYVVGDTVAGTGLAEAVTGADVVLHLAGGPKGDDVGTQHVAEAARAAGVGHLILISVIGADRMPIGYFRRKAASERIVAASGVPWTVLRATQFHSFARTMAGGMARLPIVPVMRDVRVESVAVEDVAQRLAELAEQPPQGRVADLAGPQVRTLEELIRTLPGRAHPQLRFGLPGALGRAYRNGENLAGPGADRGTGTWEEYLGAVAA